LARQFDFGLRDGLVTVVMEIAACG
jgi:hypothetical protein